MLLTHDGKLIYVDGKFCTTVPDDCCCLCNPTPETMYVQWKGTPDLGDCEECVDFWATKKPLIYSPSGSYSCRWYNEFEFPCHTPDGEIPGLVLKIELVIYPGEDDGDANVAVNHQFFLNGNLLGWAYFSALIVDFDCTDIGDLLCMVKNIWFCFEEPVCEVTNAA